MLAHDHEHSWTSYHLFVLPFDKNQIWSTSYFIQLQIITIYPKNSKSVLFSGLGNCYFKPTPSLPTVNFLLFLFVLHTSPQVKAWFLLENGKSDRQPSNTELQLSCTVHAVTPLPEWLISDLHNISKVFRI